MKKISFMLIGLTLMLTTKVYAYDDHDFQAWNTDVEEFKINKDAKIALEEEFRWGDNASEFFYHHYDIGFFYSLSKFLNLGGGYRQVYELKSNKFKAENEPYVTATLLWQNYGFSLESRNRFEYRHFDYQHDSGRYRNKFTLKLPWKFTKFQIQPYAGDEVLIGFGDGATELNQNRFCSGFALNLTKNLKAEFYYMLVSSKGSDRWTDANVLGTKIKFAF